MSRSIHSYIIDYDNFTAQYDVHLLAGTYSKATLLLNGESATGCGTSPEAVSSAEPVSPDFVSTSTHDISEYKIAKTEWGRMSFQFP